MWHEVGFVVLVVVIMIIGAVCFDVPLPPWAQDPCRRCGGLMQWVKGSESKKHEARFQCKGCGTKEYRGGPLSELTMEEWEHQ